MICTHYIKWTHSLIWKEVNTTNPHQHSIETHETLTRVLSLQHGGDTSQEMYRTDPPCTPCEVWERHHNNVRGATESHLSVL